MGIEDRDWYRKIYTNKAGKHRTGRSRSGSGGEWHWATQTLVWLLVLMMVFLIFRTYDRRAKLRQTPPATANPIETKVPPQASQRQEAPLEEAYAPAPTPATPPRIIREQSFVSTIYLCQSYGGGKFWSSAHCQQNNALIDRMETVPSNMPFEQQVALAQQQSREAAALSAPPPVRQQATPPELAQPNLKAQCDALDAEIRHWDAMARAPQSAQMQDWITGRRKIARDTQFRLRC